MSPAALGCFQGSPSRHRVGWIVGVSVQDSLRGIPSSSGWSVIPPFSWDLRVPGWQVPAGSSSFHLGNITCVWNAETLYSRSTSGGASGTNPSPKCGSVVTSHHLCGPQPLLEELGCLNQFWELYLSVLGMRGSWDVLSWHTSLS